MRLHTYLYTLLLYLSAIGLGTAQPSFSWDPIDSPPGVEVIAMTALPDGTLYIGAKGLGIFRTQDQGQTWTAVNEGLPDKPWEKLRRLIATPDGSIYLLYGDPLYSVFYKSDSSSTWQAISLPQVQSSNNLEMVAVNPQGDLLLGFSRGAVFKSTVGGGSFQQLVSEDDIIGSTDDLRALGDNRNYLYTGYGSSGNLYAFDDDGNNLQLLLEGSDSLGDIYYDSENDRLLVSIGSRLFASDDEGASWEQITVDASSSAQPTITQFFTLTDGYLYCLAKYRFFKSLNGGLTWQAASPLGSIPLGSVPLGAGVDMKMVRTEQGDIFIAENNCQSQGLLHTPNEGQDWIDIKGGFNTPTVTWIAKSSDGKLFVKTCADDYVHYAEEDGGTWQHYILQPQGLRLYTLRINKHNQYFAIAEDGALYRSLNEGVSWENLAYPFPIPTPGIARQKLIFDHQGNPITFGTLNQGKSTDLGNTWLPISFPASTIAPYQVDALSHPDGRLFFFSRSFTNSAVWQSTDGGGSWEEIDFGATGDFGIANVHITAGGTILIIGHPFGFNIAELYVSTDGGQSFEFRQSPSAYHLVSDPQGILFSYSYTDVFHSIDNGASWSQIRDGLPEGARFPTMHIGPDEHLYMGLVNNTIYRTAVPTATRQTEGSPEGRLLAVPNPAGPETLLQLSGLPAADYHLELYSAHGQLLRRASFHGLDYRLERQGLPSGLYLARVREARSGRVVGVARVVF